MLAPLVFEAFLVLVEEAVARTVEADGLGGCAQYLPDASAAYGDFIELGHGGAWKEGAFGRVLDSCREQDVFAVRGECGRDFSRGVCGEPLGCSAVGGHHEYVEVAVSVAGKGYLLAVRRPYGSAFIGLLRGELYGCTALCRDFIDVSFITEGDFRSVGRDLYVTHPEGCCCVTGEGGETQCEVCEYFLHNGMVL